MTVLDTYTPTHADMEPISELELAVQLDERRANLAQEFNSPAATVASFEINVCAYLNAYQKARFDNATTDGTDRAMALPDEMNNELVAIAGYTMDTQRSMTRITNMRLQAESATPAKVYSDVMVSKLSRLMFDII